MGDPFAIDETNYSLATRCHWDNLITGTGYPVRSTANLPDYGKWKVFMVCSYQCAAARYPSHSPNRHLVGDPFQDVEYFSSFIPNHWPPGVLDSIRRS
jgi:hypothetical protein